MVLRNESEKIVTNIVLSANAVPRGFHTLSLNSPPFRLPHNIRVKSPCKVCYDLSPSILLTTSSKMFPLLSTAEHYHDFLPLQNTQCYQPMLIPWLSGFSSHFFLSVTLILFHSFNYILKAKNKKRFLKT